MGVDLSVVVRIRYPVRSTGDRVQICGTEPIRVHIVLSRAKQNWLRLFFRFVIRKRLASKWSKLGKYLQTSEAPKTLRTAWSITGSWLNLNKVRGCPSQELISSSVRRLQR